MLDGSDAVSANPACAWMTTLGVKPTPVTAWLPVVVGIVHWTIFADTPGPEMARKWMTDAVASFVVQLRVKLVASHELRSASATSDSLHCTMVSAFAAMRRLALAWFAPFSLAAAADTLVVPSLMPNAKRYPVPKLWFVLSSVQSTRAFGASPRPWATAWLTGAADVLFVKLPTLQVAAAASVATAARIAIAAIVRTATTAGLLPGTRARCERERHAPPAADTVACGSAPSPAAGASTCT